MERIQPAKGVKGEKGGKALSQKGRCDLNGLSRRERQIMDVVYRRGRASAREVQDRIPDPPSYSAVRASMRILEEKGFLRHEKRADGRYIFEPTVQPDRARESALKRVVETFFENSAAKAMSTLLSSSELDVTEEELARLEKLIASARRERRDADDA